MTTEYQLILPELLKRELGVSNWAADRGKKTAHGITQRVADRLGIDIDTIDQQTAMDIYRVEYYEKPGFDQFNDIRYQWRLTLDALHSGPPTIIRRLQNLINLNRLKTSTGKIEVDGILGPQTNSAFNVMQLEVFHEFQNRGFDYPMNRAIWDICSQLKANQYSLYQQICMNDETQMVWWWGWTNRIRFEPDFYQPMRVYDVSEKALKA